MLTYEVDDEIDENLDQDIEHKDDDTECNHALCRYVKPSSKCTCNCGGKNHGMYYRGDGPAT